MPDDARVTHASEPPDSDMTLGAKEVTARGPEARHLPATIGQYRILRLLGEGGMGAVYEAEQARPRRRVALKVIKSAWASPELVRRFEQEFQTLGRLHHPGIAQIYEAGTADTAFGAQPYFAMEIIQGKPLIEYATEGKLNTRQRLGLMIQICEAVHHAHQRGIIHRDLKPGNIMVDVSGQPKILDFGLARVIDSDAQMTRQTDVGQLLGTLPYMSPEQVTGDPLAVDTRSDVYALGVILYELLAGKLPYQLSRHLHEAVETIQKVDPATLSMVSRVYRGDIETIVAKALEKDKNRRYGSAEEFADDIRRYMEDRPITAKPASTGYQLQKFARRHKALVAGVAAVFLVLSAGIVASTWEALKARQAERLASEQRDRATAAERSATTQRDRALAAEKSAQQERDRAVAAEVQAQRERNTALAEKLRADSETASAKAVNDFLQNDLLAQASATNQFGSSIKPDPDLKVRTALDRAATRITGKFDSQPKVEAAIRDTIGQTYIDLGLYPEARKQLERALDLDRKVLGPGDPKTLATLIRLGSVASTQGKFSEAEALFRQVLEVSRRVLGPEHSTTLKSMSGLAGIYYHNGDYAKAEELHSQAMEISSRVLGPEHPDTLSYARALTFDYYSQDKLAETEMLSSHVLEVSRRVLGPEHPSTLNSMTSLAGIYLRQLKYSQAEAMFNQALEINRRVLGPEHPNTVTLIFALGTVYYWEGKYAQAEAIQSQALEISRRASGPENPRTQQYMRVVAMDYMEEGKYAEAEALFSQALEITRRVSGPEDPITLETLSGLAAMYQRQGKYGLAVDNAAQALAGRRHKLGSEHPDTMVAAADMALAYESQGEFARSEPLAREVLDFNKKKSPKGWERFRAGILLGASLAGQKKYTEAEPLLLQGYQDMSAVKERVSGPYWYHLDLTRGWIVQLYTDWGKPDKAAEWRQKPQPTASPK